MSLRDDLLHFMYCCTAVAEDPVDARFHRALRMMWRTFDWLTPDMPPPDPTLDIVVQVAQAHVALDPVTFDDDQIIATYAVPGIPPSVWGPAAWRLLHALAADDARGLLVCSILYAWTVLLPCAQCREHLTALLQEEPPPEDGDRMDAYAVRIHNNVNALLGKARR